MRDLNERPVCHRAEDLVTYLYGEAGEADARDFRDHLQQCDACRSEFAVFNQVHESMLAWRHEALASSPTPALAAPPAIETPQFVRHERKLSALAAVREFFTIAPLWLRGATAFAGLLLCVLLVLALARSWQRPGPVANSNAQKVFTVEEFKDAVAREVKIQTEKQQPVGPPQPKDASPRQSPRPEVARVRAPAKPRIKGLSPQEREQLAADLRLIPASDDEELPFVISDQPNPDQPEKPNQ
ncbi:MAG TPA: zf-HC2 domain-containing protein [Pyrinomonadaceae bacterium]|nr:zf-HC2 domain-containing protein [Pyrinomonadaceae bacterium]